MKDELIKELIDEDKEKFETFFFDVKDYSYEKLSIDNIKQLLKIENKKIRFEALEAITNDIIINSNPNLIPLILSAFERINNNIIAAYLNFVVSSEDLLKSGKLKYIILIDTISKLEDEDKVCHICNIFWNELLYSLPIKSYVNNLFCCLQLSNDELQKLVIEICEKNNLNSLILKK